MKIKVRRYEYMTDLSFTENVNFDKLASQESSYSTKIDPENLKRLQGACVRVNGPVQADFKFYVDMQGLRTIEGTIKANVTFICQRCQKEFDKDLESSFLSTCDEQKAKSLKIDEKLDIVELDDVSRRRLIIMSVLVANACTHNIVMNIFESIIGTRHNIAIIDS